MKIKNTILFIILFMSVSCNDFLAEKPKDKIIPKTVKDYSEFLYGEAYLRDYTIAPYLDIMTDDITSFAKVDPYSKDTRNEGFGYFAWQRIPETTKEGALNSDYMWEVLYHSIIICNIVLDNVDDMQGPDNEKNNLVAEALCQRAFNYFLLVNIYGEPYNAATASTDKGVPINSLAGMADVKLPRASVKENYELIVDDLKNAIKYFGMTSILNDKFKFNLPAANLLMSRVALYMQNYEDVITYSSSVIAARPSLYDLKSANKMPDTGSGNYFISQSNPEIIFNYGYHVNIFFNEYAAANFPQSESLMNSFDEQDMRKVCFVTPAGGYNSVPRKSADASSTKALGYAFRSAEAYLNRAEAYAAKSDVVSALSDINKLRSYRIKGVSEISATAETILQTVRDERRRELCFEQHRWFDLRRYGCPRIEHNYVDDVTTGSVKVYVLEKDDSAYTLPVPTSVLLFDTDLVNIERKDRAPIK